MHAPRNIRSDRLLERFLRYVQVDTTADPDANSYPSSAGQLELGAMLVRELSTMGIDDAHQDSHGLVWASVPASVGHSLPTILFNAHLDTSPEAPGLNVRPQVIEAYAGGDICLPKSDRVIAPADCAQLSGLVGHCLVTSDGTTLLGGDDKAGVAAIMELAAHLMENPHIPHGPVRILFTCDEEIGRGAKHVDLAKAGASAAYTLDGSGRGVVENENFSADQLVVRAHGYNIHPSIAKGKMVNACRGLAELITRLPTDKLSPETSEGMQGFLHAYDVRGGVASAEARILLRDFDTAKLDEYAALVASVGDVVAEMMPGLRFEIERSRQYRNMADCLKAAPHVVAFAVQAHERLGNDFRMGSIRGGTDGAVFSEMGLPTPNLSVGQHNIHSVLEFVSLDEMVAAIEHAIQMLGLWQAHAVS